MTTGRNSVGRSVISCRAYIPTSTGLPSRDHDHTEWHLHQPMPLTSTMLTPEWPPAVNLRSQPLNSPSMLMRRVHGPVAWEQWPAVREERNALQYLHQDPRSRVSIVVMAAPPGSYPAKHLAPSVGSVPRVIRCLVSSRMKWMVRWAGRGRLGADVKPKELERPDKVLR